MSIKVDSARSGLARVNGNASFRKGKWVEAIGHYTTALIHNPRDPTAYCNRAAAYLKLDKYQDAERDCTTALEISPSNVKALYRRSLASKWLGRLDVALRDVEEVLKLEPENEAASIEVEELRGLKWKQEVNAAPRRPISPPRASASIEELPPEPPLSGLSSTPDLPASVVGSSSAASSSSSFAALRKSRDAKKTFVSPVSNGTTSSPSGSTGPINHPGQLSAKLPSQSRPPPPSPPFDRNSDAETSAARPNLDPPNPDSPGAPLLFLRRLSPLSPAEAWSLLSSLPPETVPRLLTPVLEPDVLGQVLLALHHATRSSPDLDKERIRTIMEGLKSNPRWRMNVAMLSRTERLAGEDVWRSSGGDGAWP